MAKQNAIIRQIMVTDYKAHDDDGNDYEGSVYGAYTPGDLTRYFTRMRSPLTVDDVDYRIRKYKMEIEDFVKYATPMD